LGELRKERGKKKRKNGKGEVKRKPQWGLLRY